MDAIKVKITKDSLYGKCVNTGNIYLIHHESEKGEDITDLAEIASKSPWFIEDNPHFNPNTEQVAEILENGRIKIIPFLSSEELVNLAESKT